MENHNKYLGVYIKRHFGGQVEPGNDSDYGTLMEDGKERCGDYKVHELLNCQTKLVFNLYFYLILYNFTKSRKILI